MWRAGRRPNALGCNYTLSTSEAGRARYISDALYNDRAWIEKVDNNFSHGGVAGRRQSKQEFLRNSFGISTLYSVGGIFRALAAAWCLSSWLKDKGYFFFDLFLNVASSETSSSWGTRNILQFGVKASYFEISRFTQVAFPQCVGIPVFSTVLRSSI